MLVVVHRNTRTRLANSRQKAEIHLPFAASCGADTDQSCIVAADSAADQYHRKTMALVNRAAQATVAEHPQFRRHDMAFGTLFRPQDSGVQDCRFCRRVSNRSA